MMQCRGMGAVTKKGNKPKVMAKGKKVPGKLKGYAGGMTLPLPVERYDPRGGMRDAVVGGRRMAKGKTVKRKMKGKKV